MLWTLGYSAPVSSENTDLVQRLVVAYTANDLETALTILDPNVRVYPRPDEPGTAEVYEGHEGLFAYLENWMGQWDEYESDPVSFRDAPEDRVMVVMSERGHLKRTGITVNEDFTHSFTVAGDRVTEWRMYDSHAQALEALGLQR
jgi:ketosteroid isomerase-like protein